MTKITASLKCEMTIIKMMRQRKYQKCFRLLTSVMRDPLVYICISNIWKYIDTTGWDIKSIKMTPKWLGQTILYPYFMAFLMYVIIFKVVPLLHIFLALICNAPCLNFNLILTHSVKPYLTILILITYLPIVITCVIHQQYFDLVLYFHSA